MKKKIVWLLAIILGTAMLTSLVSQTQIGQDILGEETGQTAGRSVSLSEDGTRMAVGVPVNRYSLPIGGSVRVFELISGLWVQLGSDIAAPPTNRAFGYQVVLSPDGKRVGVLGGGVRVFELQGGDWVQLGNAIDGNNISLSFDGNRALIGSDPGWRKVGKVNIYDFVAGSWVQVGHDLWGEKGNDRFGASISLSSDGKRFAVGGPQYIPGAYILGQKGGGYVKIFEWNGDWFQRGSTIRGQADRDYFGASVSLSSDGNVLAVGAFGNDDNGEDAGQVRVYEWSSTDWNQKGMEINGDSANRVFNGITLGNYLGYVNTISLSANGNVLALGASRGKASRGEVQVFGWDGSTWIKSGNSVIGKDGERLGTSVSISPDGKRIAAGGPGASKGVARVYEWIDSLPNNAFPSGSLPVGEIAFSAWTEDDHIVFKWAPSFQFDFTGFEIEQSQDKFQWNTLVYEEKRGDAFSQYEIRKPILQEGPYYYRLKQIGTNGSSIFTRELRLNLIIDDQLKIFPNPTNGQLNILSRKTGAIAIYNELGQFCYKAKTIEPTIDLSPFKSGLYIIQLQYEDELVVRRIIKQ